MLPCTLWCNMASKSLHVLCSQWPFSAMHVMFHSIIGMCLYIYAVIWHIHHCYYVVCKCSTELNLMSCDLLLRAVLMNILIVFSIFIHSTIYQITVQMLTNHNVCNSKYAMTLCTVLRVAASTLLL